MSALFLFCLLLGNLNAISTPAAFPTKTISGINISLSEIFNEITPNHSTHYYWLNITPSINYNLAKGSFALTKNTNIQNIQLLPITSIIKYNQTTIVPDFDEATGKASNQTTIVPMLNITTGATTTMATKNAFLLTFDTPNFATDTFNITLATYLLDPTISACGTITIAGHYDQTQNLDAGNGNCIIISAVGTEYDCNGYRINATPNSNYGIKVNNLANISNCNVSGFTDNYYIGATDTRITNSNGSGGNARGLYSTTDRIIVNNSYFNAPRGMILSGSSGQFFNTTFIGNASDQAVWQNSGSLNNFTNCTFISTNVQGFAVYGGGTGQTFINNTFLGQAYCAFTTYISDGAGANSIFIGNTFNQTKGGCYVGFAAVSMTQGSNFTFVNNTIQSAVEAFYANVSTGIFSNNYVTGNTTGSFKTINMSSAAGGWNLTNNTIMGWSWISDTNGTNNYNDSTKGNIYRFPNGTIYSCKNWTGNTWATAGTPDCYPLNATTAPTGYWAGLGTDWHPYIFSTLAFSQMQLCDGSGTCNLYNSTCNPYQTMFATWASFTLNATDNGPANATRTYNCTITFINGSKTTLSGNYANGTGTTINITGLTAADSGDPIYADCTATVNSSGLTYSYTTAANTACFGAKANMGRIVVGINQSSGTASIGFGGSIIWIAIYVLLIVLWIGGLNRVLTAWLGAILLLPMFAYLRQAALDAAISGLPSLFGGLLILSFILAFIFSFLILLDFLLNYVGAMMGRKHRSLFFDDASKPIR